MITHLLDSLHRRDDIRVVSVHHEQAAAFAAEGSARMSGVPGVAMATSGPGATNLVTGIGSCYFDSVPAVFITGQVNTHELRGESGVRQAGFQETDIVAVAGPLTKGAWRAETASQVPELLERAFRTALEGRPGPVLLDIPMDVQHAEVPDVPAAVDPTAPAAAANIDEVLDLVANAERPLILAGGGVRSAHAADAVRELAETMSIPVASTLMGIDVLPHSHPLRVGLVGTYGNRWANLAMRDADCLLVLGARLEVRQTGSDTETFSAGKAIIRVDVDPAQLAWRVPATSAIVADLGEFAREACGLARGRAWRDRTEWRDVIAAHRSEWADRSELADCVGINPAEAMHVLSDGSGEASAYVVDVGQNQMWAAQSLRLREGQRFLTSGGMGAMGFALPAAMGVALAEPGRPVVAISGDGGMQVNIQELDTISRLGLAVKMVVFNNGCLGMVRQFQHELFEARYQSTVWGYGTPDFVAVASAYGIDARRVDESGGLAEAVGWLMHDPDRPALLEVAIDPNTCVRPKVAYGDSAYLMSPPPVDPGPKLS